MDPYIALIRLIEAEPSLLPPVEVYDQELWAQAIIDRTRTGGHLCLKCGEKAKVAYIAQGQGSCGWLDLCPPCALAMSKAVAMDRPLPSPED